VKSKILPSIVLLLIFCMCTKENQLLNPNVNDVLMPLKIGNFWEYKTESDKIIKESIDSLYVKNGINIYILNSDMGTWFAAQAVYNTPDGYFIDNRLFVNEDNHEFIFKYPCVKGMKWSNTNNFFGINVTHNYEVLSVNETIKLSSGVFHCYVYKVYSKDTQSVINEILYQSFEKYYFDPKIGLVLIKTVITDDNFNPISDFKEITSRELIDFSVNDE